MPNREASRQEEDRRQAAREREAAALHSQLNSLVADMKVGCVSSLAACARSQTPLQLSGKSPVCYVSQMASEALVQEARQLLAAERSRMDQLHVRIRAISVTAHHRLPVLQSHHFEGSCNSLAPEVNVKVVCS